MDQLSSSNGCTWAGGQALEAVSTEGFMVSSGRLGGGCAWERVVPGESSRQIVQPCCSGPASPFLASAGRMPQSRKHQSNLLSHTSIPLPPFLHACIKPSLEQNSTTLFIPWAANSSSISQPGPKGLRWVVNFKAGLFGDLSSVGHGHPCGQVPSLHAVKSRCGVKTSFWGGHD